MFDAGIVMWNGFCWLCFEFLIVMWTEDSCFPVNPTEQSSALIVLGSRLFGDLTVISPTLRKA